MNVKRKHIVVMISRFYSGTIKRVWASGFNFKSKMCKRNNMSACVLGSSSANTILSAADRGPDLSRLYYP